MDIAAFDPGAPPGLERMAEAQTGPEERFLSVLMLIDRTVLPRHAELAGENASVRVDLAEQCLQLGVRAGNHFAIDDALASAAPNAYKLLRRRARNVARHDEVLKAERAAVCACAARALYQICARGPVRHRVAPAEPDEVFSAAAFSVIELYESARDQMCDLQGGPVSAFYDAIRPKMAESWLFSSDGWVLDAPEASRSLDRYSIMSRTAQWLGEWGTSLSNPATPQIAYAARTPHDTIWCFARDARHIALLRCAPLNWATTLNAWTHHVESAPPASMAP